MRKTLGIVESAMRHRQIVFLITTMLLVLGVYALFVMPRQEFPSFTIRQGLVIGVYPGASSAEVEEQLTSKVEKYLYGFQEIKKKDTYSVSKDGLMIVYVKLNDDVKDKDKFWAKLNDGLSNFKAQLPAGVLALYTNSDFGDTSALLVTIESDHKSYHELQSYMDELENRLRRIQSVSKLRNYGLQNEQISIYLNRGKLTNYGITPTTLLANLFTQGFTTISGTVDNPDYNAPIHIAPTYNNEKEIGEQILYADPAGNIIRLKDVARIVREYPKLDSYITNNGHKCLLISMEMQPGNNIVQYGKDVEEVLNQFQSELPDGVNIERVANQPKVVSDSISTFLLEMLYAIIAVILVTMVLLPFRVAAVASTSIPITVFISLGIMYLTGIELNTVSLAALIVVLGMIVDNSIVIVDSYMEKLDQGMSRWHASISSARGFFKAIFSATLAISITFFPFLATTKGMINDFVHFFPWTVTLTLGISLLVAMFLIPFLQYVFIKNGFEKSKWKKKEGRRSFLDIVQQTYEKWLGRAFRHPKVTIGAGIVAVLVGGILFSVLPRQLMPIAERDQFPVEIYLPQGSSLEQTAQVADSLEQILNKDARVKSITSFVGTSSPRFHTTYAPQMPAKNYAQFIVNTHSNRETEEMLNEYSQKYADYFPNAHIRFKQLSYQEAANPIEVRVSGSNLSDLKSIADSLIAKMRTVPGITWVHTNFKGMLPGTEVSINDTEANRLGITKTLVSTNLAIDFDGLPLTTLWEGDYKIPVKLKSERANKAVSYGDIEDKYIHSIIPGVSVPLRQITNVKPDWTQGQIVRRNGIRTITIESDVVRGANTNEVFRAVKSIADNQQLPAGIRISYGGAHETDSDMLPQVIGALLISVFIIFMILVFHFKKPSLALLVLSSATLSIVGAALGMLIMGKDFGVTSILGVISLIGILVRNGIIMLDYAEELRHRHKKTVLEAAFEAGKRRMRPIFLTSAAASMGVIPMIISNSSLWAPMGTVICFGTLTSMILLVLILPVAYWMIFRSTERKESKLTIDEIANKSKMKPVILTALALLLLAPVTQAQERGYTLKQCKTLALENNASVKNKVLDVQSAEQAKKAAYTKYFPQVEATTMAFKYNKSVMNMKIPGGDLPVYDGNAANLSSATQYAYFPGMNISLLKDGAVGLITATEPVYAGGRVTTGNKLANLGIEVNQLQLTSTEKEIALNTEKQYWQIEALNEKMKTLERYMLMVDTLHKEVTDSYQAGLITRNDLLKVELKQNELKMNHLKLANGIKLAKMALCQYIGIDYGDSISFTDTIPQAKTPEEYYINHAEALAKRPEYQLLQKSSEAEKYKTKLQRGEYMPQIGVGVGGQYLDIDSNSSTTGMVFGTVKIPISGWWEASHKLKERRLKEEQNVNTVNDNTQKLLLQMQQVRDQLDEAYQQVQLAKISVQQAEENLKENNDNYKAGMIRVSDMMEAQAQVQQSHDRYVDALTQYLVTKVHYLEVTGR